jgi:hypothetical protein
MMAAQARSSVTIMGLDTHMILESRACFLLTTQNRSRSHQPVITPLCRGRVACGGCASQMPRSYPR